MATVIGKSQQATKQTTCGNCASIIEYTKSDTEQRRSVDYTGGVDIDTVLRCPGCGKQIRV